MLQQHLNKRQLFEWLAYYQLEPFGEERDDIRSSAVIFWLRALWLEDSREEPKDFMPRFEEHEPTEAELIISELADLAAGGALWR